MGLNIRQATEPIAEFVVSVPCSRCGKGAYVEAMTNETSRSRPVVSLELLDGSNVVCECGAEVTISCSFDAESPEDVDAVIEQLAQQAAAEAAGGSAAP